VSFIIHAFAALSGLIRRSRKKRLVQRHSFASLSTIYSSSFPAQAFSLASWFWSSILTPICGSSTLIELARVLKQDGFPSRSPANCELPQG
jgi:hypothetical protein